VAWEWDFHPVVLHLLEVLSLVVLQMVHLLVLALLMAIQMVFLGTPFFLDQLADLVGLVQ
jgi:hypothetical protein